MKKPDRWERRIGKIVNVGESYDPFIYYEDVVKMLRQEHRAVVKIVQNEIKQLGSKVDEAEFASVKFGLECKVVQCQAILDHLKRRAK